MAKYTTLVRSICESVSGLSESKGFNNVQSIIEAAEPSIFNFNYPIFDESYRHVLNCKILKHYYMREIGEETVGLWKLRLDQKLNDIMPYYNKLYNSELLEINPLYNVDITTTKEGTESKTGNTVEEGTKTTDNDTTSTLTNNLMEDVQESGTDSLSISKSVNLAKFDEYSDTPQGSLQNVESGTYLTNARKITESNGESGTNTTTYGKDTAIENTGTQTNVVDGTIGETINNETTSSITNDVQYVEHVVGKNSGISFSKSLIEYRETFINIDLMIMDELKCLFMGLW